MALPIPAIRFNAPLRTHNTFGITAQARALVRIQSADQIAQVLSQLDRPTQEQGLQRPLFVLGGGSNIVLTQDVAATVLKVEIMGKVIIDQTDQHWVVEAGAGESWHEFVQWTVQQGFGGLENLALIPGTVGAAPVQNIGAYGIELKDRMQSLVYVDLRNGTTHTLTTAQCQFAYRDSIFKHDLAGHALITKVRFALPRRWMPITEYADVSRALAAQHVNAADVTAQQIFDAIVAIRQAKLPDPAQIGNAGSFFKNPVVDAYVLRELQTEYPSLVHYALPDGTFKLAAGWLIDSCGWKGKTIGRAGVYEKQALVLVNRGGASGTEVMHLARAIQQTVMEKFGVRLEPEPIVL